MTDCVLCPNTSRTFQHICSPEKMEGKRERCNGCSLSKSINSWFYYGVYIVSNVVLCACHVFLDWEFVDQEVGVFHLEVVPESHSCKQVVLISCLQIFPINENVELVLWSRSARNVLGAPVTAAIHCRCCT